VLQLSAKKSDAVHVYFLAVVVNILVDTRVTEVLNFLMNKKVHCLHLVKNNPLLEHVPNLTIETGTSSAYFYNWQRELL
jgi:hypothetical protein